MFWSKIWFFIIAVVGAIALAIALILPRPAERQRVVEERQRIVTACDVVNILLRDNARNRISLAAQFARAEIDVGKILGPATSSAEISENANKTARAAAANLIASTKKGAPNFVYLLDGRGRVVARQGKDEKFYGDSLAGYELVQDALDGYLRDDLWFVDKQLYLIAGSPVIRNDYVGAVIIGHEMNKELADQFVSQLGVDLNVYVDGQAVATSNSIPLHKEIVEKFARDGDLETPIAEDCRNFEPFPITVGSDTYTALLARLPGQAGSRNGAFLSVFVQRPGALGLTGTLSAANKGDLAFGTFPWLSLGLLFVVCVAIGVFLMIWETDLPLRKLTDNAVALAKGDIERLDEDRHRGKFGSIARSINIHIDKIRREAREKKRDLSGILGPPPEALPQAGLGDFSEPAHTPPPSEFRFSDSNPRIPKHTPPPTPIPGRAPTPPPVPMSDHTPVPKLSLDSLGSSPLVVNGSPDDEQVFQQVFKKFLALKQECNESIANLTAEKFSQKLRKNRDSLMAKHGCNEVRFEVYIKEGKAALKATPIKS